MGWDFQREPLPRDRTTEDHVASMFDLVNSEGQIQEVIAKARAGSTVYLALKVTQRDRAPFVTALVVLTERTRSGFGHKTMDETFGPVESNAPASILRLLSPVADVCHHAMGQQWAAEWRARCRANLDAKKAA
jgi:hypothetical protein